jgi:hypothetical protein
MTTALEISLVLYHPKKQIEPLIEPRIPLALAVGMSIPGLTCLALASSRLSAYG